MAKSAVIAVGGNSLIRAGEKGTIPEQIANARVISKAIAALMKTGLHLVVTHGNGPQVGAQLLRSERAAGQVYEQGLDVCVAATQGEIGYILQQALQLEFQLAGIRKPVSTVLTQVVVRADDPGFQRPTKPIGPFYSHAAAEEKARLFGWEMIEDASRGYRRVVASPAPVEIIEAEVIRCVMDQGILVIAAGGGGIPVVRDNGLIRGVEAVIDKDRASVLLAMQLSVDLLVFSTDADYVYLNFKRPGQRALRRIGLQEIMTYHAAGEFPPGSMGPKVEAAIRFLQSGGKEAIITSLENLAEAMTGEAGTHIVPEIGGQQS
ncbi:MAG: carbamate kinase [Acidobacteriia bacterium]|nr:carbamate kinase [Terriglobia bacterium]